MTALTRVSEANNVLKTAELEVVRTPGTSQNI